MPASAEARHPGLTEAGPGSQGRCRQQSAGTRHVGVAAEAHRYLLAILIPADGYDPQTANGVFSHGFGNQRNGSVTFDSSVAGHYVLTTVPRLEIRGATPF